MSEKDLHACLANGCCTDPEGFDVVTLPQYADQYHKMTENASSKESSLHQLQKTLKLVDYLSETLNDFLLEQTDTMTQIGELNKQLKALESKRSDLKDQIQSARAFKKKMENAVHGLRCSLSPMWNLPTEILIQVFKVATKEANLSREKVICTGGYEAPPRNQTSLYLAQVCSRWRQIFSDNPQLWKYVEFCAWYNGPSVETKLERHRFKRAIKAGLPNQQSLFIPNWNIPQHRLIQENLGQQSTPYKELEIEVCQDPDGMVWDMKALKSHETMLYCGPRSPQVTTVAFFLPLLRFSPRVTVYGIVPTWGGQLWALLRELSIVDFAEPFCRPVLRRFGRAELTQLLDAAPFLENLQLRFTVNEAHLAWDDTVSMSHDHLKSLSIHLHHFIGGKGLLGVNLNLPNLHTLHFLSIACRSTTSNEGRFICDSMTPANVILPKLAIHDVQLTAELLRWLPSAKRLDVEGGNVDQLVTFTRAAYHQLPPLITPLPSPALTTLHVENTDIQGETLLEFVRVKLQHRMAGTEGVCAVECVEMYDTPGVSVADWEKVQDLLGEGRTANSAHPSTE